MKLKRVKHYITEDSKYINNECRIDGLDGFFKIVGFENNCVLLSTRYSRKIKYKYPIEKCYLTQRFTQYEKNTQI